jgi:hypothetical protein
MSRAERVQGAIVLVASAAYLSHVFQVFHEGFWTSGMGDWMDPYFINALLEHWHYSFWRVSDPTSPPMFFPATHTLGYSHSLVLYAPFYLPLRLLAHPFLAYNLAIFAVIHVGILCLYVLLRKLGTSFLEALLLTAFFATSANVVGEATSIWSQRASVFLIPPILLMALGSREPGHVKLRLTLAFFSGLCATLLFAHDFYTAQLGVIFVVFVACGALFPRGRGILERIRAFWNDSRLLERAAAAAAVLLAAWSVFVWKWGGGAVDVFGVAIRSRDWRRPTVLAIVSLGAFLWMWSRERPKFTERTAVTPWLDAFATGAVVGCIVFLWIYLGAYVEHRKFPEEHLLSALSSRDLEGLSTPWTFLRDLSPYETSRPFLLVLAAAVLGWVPWFAIGRKVRFFLLGLVLVSTMVLVVPLRFDGFSFWRTFIEPLPGFGVIRDPRRIIYLYELFVVLAVGFLLTRTPRESKYRLSIAAVILVLLLVFPNRHAFAYARPIAAYDRWVAAPITIDPSCRSFFIRAASDEYTSRSNDMWTLYSIDSLFVALTHSIPTLNGYSAWSPDGWNIMNPSDPDYGDRVRHWIEQRALHGVCELDLDARTMKPVRGPR